MFVYFLKELIALNQHCKVFTVVKIELPKVGKFCWQNFSGLQTLANIDHCQQKSLPPVGLLIRGTCMLLKSVKVGQGNVKR